jgi:ABC-type transport system involved in multi-copper enzyme maturation permease subunit
MVLDPNEIIPFLDWLPGAFGRWLLVLLCAGLAATLFGWLMAAIRHGPVAATRVTGQVLRGAVIDLVGISPRRVLALARLAVQESIRRRVVVVFGVFILILLFAGWYLDRNSIDPARLYLDFVLTATTYLLWLLALFLSSMSLPADFKSHTIYTVVTKPVRASEIVLGRIVGFTAVATLLLVVMGTISYFFVQRGLAHTHRLDADVLQPIDKAAAGQQGGLQGLTSKDSKDHSHRHKVVISPSGEGRVEIEQRHWHPITAHKEGGKTTYEIGREEGMLVARVPVYGKLRFLDRLGQPADKGINVGDEWTYRSFVDGGSMAAAIWTFDGITEDRFPDGLPVEMTIEVFRTHKGNIEKGVPGSLIVCNPANDKVRSAPRIFESREFVVDEHFIPRELEASGGKKLDLFKDLVSDGRVEIRLKCEEPQQNFGVAQADMYLRAGDASFVLNFAKGYLGIWLQLVVVITIGVMFSTFLSGPVAIIATLGVLVGGFFSDFMLRLATRHTYGGGPFESLYRLLTQDNMTVELPPGLTTNVVKILDQPSEACLWLLANVLPDFGRFSFSEYVASGFDIPGDTILAYTCRAFAFVLPVFVVGYLCLKNREIAK